MNAKILRDPEVPTGGPGHGGPPTGANLPPPPLPGSGPQPTNPGKPPGYGPIYQYLYLSFILRADPLTLDDARVAEIARACERAADRALADFRRFGGAFGLPTPMLPPSWVGTVHN